LRVNYLKLGVSTSGLNAQKRDRSGQAEMDELYRHLARRLLRYWHIFYDALAALSAMGVSSSTATLGERPESAQLSHLAW
jgi:hypothetical protein